MANTRAQNVWVIDTSGQIDGAHCLENVKLVTNGADATVTIKADSTSGTVVYSARAASGSDNYDHDLGIQLTSGFYVTITGTNAKAYLYVE
jgi:hypothetical protein